MTNSKPDRKLFYKEGELVGSAQEHQWEMLKAKGFELGELDTKREKAQLAKTALLERLSAWKFGEVVVDLTNETLWKNAVAKMGAVNARAALGAEYKPITLTTGLSVPVTFKSAKMFIEFYTAAEVENEEAVAEMYAATQT